MLKKKPNCFTIKKKIANVWWIGNKTKYFLRKWTNINIYYFIALSLFIYLAQFWHFYKNTLIQTMKFIANDIEFLHYHFTAFWFQQMKIYFKTSKSGQMMRNWNLFNSLQFIVFNKHYHTPRQPTIQSKISNWSRIATQIN